MLIPFIKAVLPQFPGINIGFGGANPLLLLDGCDIRKVTFPGGVDKEVAAWLDTEYQIIRMELSVGEGCGVGVQMFTVEAEKCHAWKVEREVKEHGEGNIGKCGKAERGGGRLEGR